MKLILIALIPWMSYVHICKSEDGVLYEHADYEQYTLIENKEGVCKKFAQAMFFGSYINKELRKEIDSAREKETYNFLYRYRNPQDTVKLSELNIPIIYADEHYTEDIVIIERPTKYIISSKTEGAIYEIIQLKYYDAIIKADLGVKEVWSGNQLTLQAAVQSIVRDQMRRMHNDIERIQKCGSRYRLSLYRYADDVSFLDSITLLRIPYIENKLHQ